MKWYRVVTEGAGRRREVELEVKDMVEAIATASNPRITGIPINDPIKIICEQISEPV